mgnify:FL=1
MPLSPSCVSTKVIELSGLSDGERIDLTDSGLPKFMHLFGVVGYSISSTERVENSISFHDGLSDVKVFDFDLTTAHSEAYPSFSCIMEKDAYIRITDGLNVLISVESGEITTFTMTVVYQ